MEMDLDDNLLEFDQYEACPECGKMSFAYSDKERHHVCVNEECGYVIDDDGGKESIFTKILRALKLKK